MQFLLITSTQPTVANDPITSVVPPSLSPPPLHLLRSSSPSSQCSVGDDLPLLMSAPGHAQKAPSPPWQASAYLLACPSVFLSFGLAVRSHFSPIPCFCALTISSHLPAQQGYDEPHSNKRKREGGRGREMDSVLKS